MMGTTQPEPAVVYVCSARPDGGTTVTIGLSGVGAVESRVLAVDANVQRAELAPLLDLDETPGIYELAYRTRLSPVGAEELEAHLQWRDGVGVLPGVGNRDEGAEITVPFMDELLRRAAASFDMVFIDGGRPTHQVGSFGMTRAHLWVLCPTPLGLAAFDKAVRDLDAAGASWWRHALVVLNKVSDHSFRGIEGFIERRYGLRVAGALPWAPDFWRTVETSHSIRALSVPIPDGRRYRRAYGTDAEATRRALVGLAANVSAAIQKSSAAAVEA